MTESKQSATDVPYDPPPLWIRGKAIWSTRSCGDCSNGPPCRCYAGIFLDSLAPDERRCVEAWLLHAAEEGLFL